MPKFTALTVATMIVAGVLTGANALPASALAAPDQAILSMAARDIQPFEAAGQYVFSCLLENGKTVTLGTSQPKKGACKGWLQVYIGGKQVGHINTGGKLGPGDSVSCLAGNGLFLISLFDGPIGWATAASLAVLGIGCSGH